MKSRWWGVAKRTKNDTLEFQGVPPPEMRTLDAYIQGIRQLVPVPRLTLYADTISYQTGDASSLTELLLNPATPGKLKHHALLAALRIAQSLDHGSTGVRLYPAFTFYPREVPPGDALSVCPPPFIEPLSPGATMYGPLLEGALLTPQESNRYDLVSQIDELIPTKVGTVLDEWLEEKLSRMLHSGITDETETHRYRDALTTELRRIYDLK